MWKRLKYWWHRRQLIKATEVIRKAGLTVARIEERAGAVYIQSTGGSWHRIGGKGERYAKRTMKERGTT